MSKYTYPLIFGSFVTLISATYIFRYTYPVQILSIFSNIFVCISSRHRLLPEPLEFKAEADKFLAEDKDARQVLKQAMFELRA